MSHSSSGFVPKGTLGIDLGTTNTVCAQQGEVLGEGAGALLPSVVAYPPTGEMLVGHAARRRRTIDPRNTLSSIKRLIGAVVPSSRAQRFAERHPYEIVERDGRAMVRTRAGLVDPVEVAAAVLREICLNADREPSGCSVVITVPASFGPLERDATVEAARLAGFVEAQLVEEPVATAVAYLDRCNLRYAAVYDFGGGTFDLAVVDCLRYPFRVVAHAGDPYLGGDDVDRGLATRVAEDVLRTHRWDIGADQETFARLTAACEAAKVSLADRPEAVIDLAAVDPAAPWTHRPYALDRETLREVTQDLVQRTFGICDGVLGEAGLKPRDIDAVFLAGGSSALPGVRDMVQAYFGKRARFDVDPMHVVARGASVVAARPGLSQLLEDDGFFAATA